MPRKVLWSFLTFLIFIARSPSTLAQEDPQARTSAQTVPSVPTGFRTFRDDMFSNTRHKFGFTLGVIETYENNVFNSSAEPQKATATVFYPRVSLNLGKRKTRFQGSYSFGYWLYNTRRSLDTSEHYGDIQLTHELSRRVSLQVMDQISSSPTRYGSFMSPIFSPINSQPGFTSQAFLARQRITQNIATASLNFLITRKSHLSLYGNWGTYLFQSEDFRNVNGVQVGARYDHQLTSWLFFSSNYATYLNKVDPMYRNLQIQRLQVGGLNFKLGKTWSTTIAGGVEFTNNFGRYLFTESVSGSLSWQSQASIFYVSYNRGFYTTIGIPQLFQSQQMTAGVGSRLASWVNFQISAYYNRGSAFVEAGKLEYLFSRGGLDFALRPDLVASVYGGYQKQREEELGSLARNGKGYIAYLGLQYMFPSVRR